MMIFMLFLEINVVVFMEAGVWKVRVHHLFDAATC